MLNVDPLAESMASWSPYVYTYNNPIRFTDPTGMEPDDIIIRTKNSQGEYIPTIVIKSEIVDQTIDLDLPSPLLQEPLTNKTVQEPLVIDKVGGIGFDDVLTAGSEVADAWALEFSGDGAVVLGSGANLTIAGFLDGPDSGNAFAYWGVTGLAGIEGGSTINAKAYSSLISISQFGRETLSGNEFGFQGTAMNITGSVFRGYSGSVGMGNQKAVYDGFSAGFGVVGHPALKLGSASAYWTQSTLIGKL